jgi:hypothetical protein
LLNSLQGWQRGEKFIRPLAEAPLGQLLIKIKVVNIKYIMAFSFHVTVTILKHLYGYKKSGIPD